MKNNEVTQPNIEPTDADLKNNPGCALALLSVLNPKNICNGIRKKREARKEEKRQKEAEIKKQRELAELREKQEAKRRQLEEEKKLKLYKEFVDGEIEKLVSKSRIDIENDNEKIESRNKTCPNCGSKNVVNHIGNTTGSVRGEVHGSGYVSGGLFYTYGSSHVNGSVNGKTETLPVSHCNDCSNEWIQERKKSTWTYDIVEEISPSANLLIYEIEKYLEGEYTDILIDDEKDREEKAFNQLLYESSYYLNDLKCISIETLAYLYSGRKSGHWHSNKTYQYKFPKNIESVLEKIGFKYGYKDQ